ncbi:MAG: inositol-3-phosphate synthase, partial [Gemmataceae bacterium]
MSVPERRVGLWLVGAYGGVGSTTALGLAALARGLHTPVGLVTALPEFAHADFDSPTQFVIGGHDIRQSSFAAAVGELHAASNVIDVSTLQACKVQLDEWTANVRPGVLFRPNGAITALVDRGHAVRTETPVDAIELVQQELKAFAAAHQLDQLVVVNAASTEPPFDPTDDHRTLAGLQAALTKNTPALPTSSLYAYAAIDAGYAYVNLTPSRGASLPALEELAKLRGVPLAGQDLKTGETLLKSVLAPMFARRNLRVLSWVGHNILGNRDGQVLADPANKASKVRTKDALLAEVLGYKPQSLVSIEYVESLGDWKTAWDHIHFEGFLGTKMTLQLTWQGCDSILAAPLVIELARLALLAQRRGDAGTLPAAACFF